MVQERGSTSTGDGLQDEESMDWSSIDWSAEEQKARARSTLSAPVSRWASAHRPNGGADRARLRADNMARAQHQQQARAEQRGYSQPAPRRPAVPSTPPIGVPLGAAQLSSNTRTQRSAPAVATVAQEASHNSPGGSLAASARSVRLDMLHAAEALASQLDREAEEQEEELTEAEEAVAVGPEVAVEAVDGGSPPVAVAGSTPLEAGPPGPVELSVGGVSMDGVHRPSSPASAEAVAAAETAAAAEEATERREVAPAAERDEPAALGTETQAALVALLAEADASEARRAQRGEDEPACALAADEALGAGTTEDGAAALDGAVDGAAGRAASGGARAAEAQDKTVEVVRLGDPSPAGPPSVHAHETRCCAGAEETASPRPLRSQPAVQALSQVLSQTTSPAAPPSPEVPTQLDVRACRAAQEAAAGCLMPLVVAEDVGSEARELIQQRGPNDDVIGSPGPVAVSPGPATAERASVRFAGTPEHSRGHVPAKRPRAEEPVPPEGLDTGTPGSTSSLASRCKRVAPEIPRPGEQDAATPQDEGGGPRAARAPQMLTLCLLAEANHGCAADCAATHLHLPRIVHVTASAASGADGVVIGRGDTCAVQLDSHRCPAMVSRMHCALHFDAHAARWRVEDLRAQNGTAVNGKKMKGKARTPGGGGRLLEHGDLLCIGAAQGAHVSDAQYRVCLQPGATAETR